jgi:hypothetical protein
MELSRKKTWAIGGALALLAFLIGFVPTSLKNRSLNYRLQQKERALAEQTGDFQQRQAASLEKLRLAELNNQLGMLMIMTQEKNFGKARGLSTRFFDGLGRLIQDTQDNSLREILTPILKRRDEITADLTKADVGVTDKLRAFYQDMYELGVGQE